MATIVESCTLMLIGTDGSHTPIGKDGAPRFHVFTDEWKVRTAIADAVATVGIHQVHAIAVTRTRTFNGKVEHFTATHYTQNEARDIAESDEFKRKHPGGHYVRRIDGRVVRVSIPE